MRLGVEVAAIYWASGDGPATCLTTLAPERLPLLAEALTGYLDGNPAGDDPASRDAG